MKRTSIIFGAVLMLGITLNADTLLLRDGRRVQGQLISVQNNTIEFLQQEFNSSRVVRVDRDQVSGIEFGRADRYDPQYGRNSNQNQEPGSRPRGMREKQMMVVANVP